MQIRYMISSKIIEMRDVYLNNKKYYSFYDAIDNKLFNKIRKKNQLIILEQLWNNLKIIIKSVYNIIPSNNFALFLKEAEFKCNHKNF